MKQIVDQRQTINRESATILPTWIGIFSLLFGYWNRSVLVGLQNLVLSSRLWLSAGALFLIASIFVGYHQDQMDAETALAQKYEAPQRVLLQDFIAQKHQNDLGEIHVLAEAAFDQYVRIDVGTEKKSQIVDLVPIFPVSREAIAQLNNPSRAEAPSVANSSTEMSRIEAVPFGLLVFRATATAQPPEFASSHIGQGKNGPLIDVEGKLLDAKAILDQAAGPLAQTGLSLIANAIVVTPRVRDGVNAGDVSDYSTLQNTLFWVSILVLGIGSCMMVSNVSGPRKQKTKARANQVKAVGAFPAVNPFQPIAGQDEIGADAEDEPRERVSRVLTMATNAFRSKSRP